MFAPKGSLRIFILVTVFCPEETAFLTVARDNRKWSKMVSKLYGLD